MIYKRSYLADINGEIRKNRIGYSWSVDLNGKILEKGQALSFLGAITKCDYYYHIYRESSISCWKKKDVKSDLLNYLGIDAARWAKAFIDRHISDAKEKPDSIDFEVMYGWFSSAIEAGKDYSKGDL